MNLGENKNLVIPFDSMPNMNLVELDIRIASILL